MRKIFIPIKEKSQRVPCKNFRKFGDSTLWERCINKFSDKFQVYVDTDSDYIFNAITNGSYQYPVIVYKRHEELCGHEISVNALIRRFVISHCNDTEDVICQLHVTSPFLSVETVIKSFDILESGNNDSVIGCNNIQSRLWRTESFGFSPVNHDPRKLIQTQDLPVYYEDNSALYTFTPPLFWSDRSNRIGRNPYFLEIPFPENMDIDTEDNWNSCKMLEGCLK